MTNGKYVTTVYDVKHHTNINPDLDFGSVHRLLLESQKFIFETYWTVTKFIEQGFDVRKVEIQNYAVGVAPKDNQVDRKHYTINYRVRVEHDPIPIAAVVALAEAVALVIIVTLIVYTIVTIINAGPVAQLAVIVAGIAVTAVIGWWYLARGR